MDDYDQWLLRGEFLDYSSQLPAGGGYTAIHSALPPTYRGATQM
jgi:hypothetical protein